MFYLLAASTWQDVYDETYILTFDALAGTMTEENTALNSKQVYRVVAEGEELYAWAEEDGVRREISFALEDGLLSVDYGEPLGVITYAAMEKTSYHGKRCRAAPRCPCKGQGNGLLKARGAAARCLCRDAAKAIHAIA